MATAARFQRIYDHRLKDLVHQTGDIELAVRHGVPHSTANLSDAVCTLNWLFAGGIAPGCVAATNTNGDDATNITDATYLLNHLFGAGPAPVWSRSLTAAPVSWRRTQYWAV